jgi:hypothetical protein
MVKRFQIAANGHFQCSHLLRACYGTSASDDCKTGVNMVARCERMCIVLSCNVSSDRERSQQALKQCTMTSTVV